MSASAPGLIETYDDLVEAFIARRKALGWTQLEVDERAGWPSGYCGKLESWRGPQGRVASSVSLPLWFEVLGIRLTPVTCPPSTGRRPPLDRAQLSRRIPETVLGRRPAA